MDTDRGPKLDFYKLLPTVRHIALVYQDQMPVEHHRRGEQGFELEFLKHPAEVLHLEAIDFRIDLARIHFDVTVLGKAPARRRRPAHDPPSEETPTCAPPF